MPKFAKLGQLHPVEIVTLDGETLTAKYHLPSMSILQIQRVRETVDEAEQTKDTTQRADILARELTPVIREWDYQEEDGTPTPITTETLRAQGDTQLCELWKAVEEDSLPKLVICGISNSALGTEPDSESSGPTGGEST